LFFDKKGPGAKLKNESDRFKRLMTLPKFLSEELKRVKEKKDELNDEEKVLMDL